MSKLPSIQIRNMLQDCTWGGEPVCATLDAPIAVSPVKLARWAESDYGDRRFSVRLCTQERDDEFTPMLFVTMDAANSPEAPFPGVREELYALADGLARVVPAALWKAYLHFCGARKEFADNLLGRAIKAVQEQVTLERSLQSLTRDSIQSRQPDSGSDPLLFDSVIRGLGTIPGYLRIQEDIGLSRTLEAGMTLAKFPCRTLFRPKREREANSACYLPALDLCLVDGKRPTGQELVRSLSETGGLGPCFDALTHEFTHVMQVGIGYRRAIRAITVGLVAAPLAAGAVFGVTASLICCGALALGAMALGAAIGRSAKGTSWSEFRDHAPFEVHAYFYSPRLSPLIDPQGRQSVTCFVVIEPGLFVAEQSARGVVGDARGRVALTLRAQEHGDAIADLRHGHRGSPFFSPARLPAPETTRR